jgi:hypothetical protein
MTAAECGEDRTARATGECGENIRPKKVPEENPKGMCPKEAALCGYKCKAAVENVSACEGKVASKCTTTLDPNTGRCDCVCMPGESQRKSE